MTPEEAQKAHEAGHRYGCLITATSAYARGYNWQRVNEKMANDWMAAGMLWEKAAASASVDDWNAAARLTDGLLIVSGGGC